MSFTGGRGGSTAGGMKVIRILVLCKAFRCRGAGEVMGSSLVIYSDAAFTICNL